MSNQEKVIISVLPRRLTRDKHSSLIDPIMSNQYKVIMTFSPRKLTRDKHASLVGPIMTVKEKGSIIIATEGLPRTNT